MGVLDFAGGTVVHISSGVSGLVASIVVGARRKSQEAPPSNPPFIILGGALLWFGWTAFNGGSALGADNVATRAVVNTNLAAAASMLTWLLGDWVLKGYPSSIGSMV